LQALNLNRECLALIFDPPISLLLTVMVVVLVHFGDGGVIQKSVVKFALSHIA